MKVTVDLSDWIVDALLSWSVPDELAEATIEERLAFLAEDAALSTRNANARDKQAKLYRSRGLRHPDDDNDDDVPL